MKKPNSIHIIDAERLDDGITVTFSDGKTAFYTATFLYTHQDQSSPIPDEA